LATAASADLMAESVSGRVLGQLKKVRERAVGARETSRLLSMCRQLLSERGEANSIAVATQALAIYQGMELQSQYDFFDLLAEQFDPDPGEVLRLAERYAVNRSPQTLLELSRTAEPPRQELFRRLNRVKGGAGILVKMRATLLKKLASTPHWKAVDADLEHLLSSWFNPGFLELRRIDWNSPAMLLEQLITHEAVHEIVDWNDLRRRLQPDRRCFAFFHPTLPNEPLIFVEVALLANIPGAVASLLDVSSAPPQAKTFRVATFYSISNCQPGLKGVSLGNFLIKQVAQALQEELPQLKTFCTLSPIPGFQSWLASVVRLESTRLKPRALAQLEASLRALRDRHTEWPPLWANSSAQDKQVFEALCAYYLLHTHAHDQSGSDPVARFHLGNGARLERINPQGDLSRKAVKQSMGLDEIEDNHEAFVAGDVQASRAVRGYF
jgi:malonyl-CoA decarboxylase